jgi:hypothetical protein
MRNSKTLTILSLCLLTGTLDAIAALVIGHTTSFAPIFRYIASGWFGKEAFAGGTSMMLWGILFHYLIASVWSVLLFFLYPSFSGFLKSKYLTGIVFGVIIWLIMNRLILPLTHVPKHTSPPTAHAIFNGILALILCVGLPIALVANKYYRWSFLKRTIF